MNERRILHKHILTFICLAVAFSLPYAFFAVAAWGELWGDEKTSEQMIGDTGDSPCHPCEAFHDLNTRIRDGRIEKNKAMVRFRAVMAEVKAYARKTGVMNETPDRCMFPLSGYSPLSIGGKNGSGYVAAGYDYFDGNTHGGHPAHDLFIRDRNQDSLDDVTGKQVFVVAMEDGLVVSVENTWLQNSRLRGGRYVWIYNPRHDCLTYYAHNETILVRIGDWVKPGEPLGTVGRTGYNAFQKMSPTHLHLMHLKIENGLPRPQNRFAELSTCLVR